MLVKARSTVTGETSYVPEHYLTHPVLGQRWVKADEPVGEVQILDGEVHVGEIPVEAAVGEVQILDGEVHVGEIPVEAAVPERIPKRRDRVNPNPSGDTLEPAASEPAADPKE